MQANMQEEIDRILADKDNIQYTLSQMVALMNDTDAKVDAMKSQKWYQRMIKTVFGKNKATKEEIASNHDKLNAYMAKVIAELFKRIDFTEKQLVSLGNQINQVYENIPEIKEIIYDSVTELNAKIASLDTYVVLTQKISVGYYTGRDEICSLFDVVARIDNRVAVDDEKTNIICCTLMNKLNLEAEKPLSEYMTGILCLSADAYEPLYANAVSIGGGALWARLVMQVIEQYHFLPAAEKKALAVETVVENIMTTNLLKGETKFSLSEIYDNLLEERVNQAENTETFPSDSYEQPDDGTEEAPTETVQKCVSEDDSQSTDQNSNPTHTAKGAVAESVYDEIFLALKNKAGGAMFEVSAFAETVGYCLISASYFDHTDHAWPLIVYKKADQTYTDTSITVDTKWDNGKVFVLSAEEDLVAIEVVENNEHRIGILDLSASRFHEIITDPGAILLTCADGKAVYKVQKSVCIYDFFSNQYKTVECPSDNFENAATIIGNTLFLLSDDCVGGSATLCSYNMNNASLISNDLMTFGFPDLLSFKKRHRYVSNPTPRGDSLKPTHSLIIGSTEYYLIGKDILDTFIRIYDRNGNWRKWQFKLPYGHNTKVKVFGKKIIWREESRLSTLLPEEVLPIELVSDVAGEFVLIDNWVYYRATNRTIKKFSIENPAIRKSVCDD